MVKKQKKIYASNEVPGFFKVYLPLSSEGLRIPPAFVKHFRGEIPKKAILRSCIGRSWCVAVKNDENDLFFFQSGWQSFVKDYPLNIGDFLVFSYCGNSEFYVKVFSRTGCEKKEALACRTCKKTAITSLNEELPGAEETFSPHTHGRPEISECPQPKASIPIEFGVERATKAAKSVDPENPHFTASVGTSSPCILQETKDQEVPDLVHRSQCEPMSVERSFIEEIRPIKSVKWEQAKWKLRTRKDGSSWVDIDEDASSEFSFASSSSYSSHDKKEGPETNSSAAYQNFEVLSNLEGGCKEKKIEGNSTKTSGKKPIIREVENLNWAISSFSTALVPTPEKLPGANSMHILSSSTIWVFASTIVETYSSGCVSTEIAGGNDVANESSKTIDSIVSAFDGSVSGSEQNRMISLSSSSISSTPSSRGTHSRQCSSSHNQNHQHLPFGKLGSNQRGYGFNSKGGNKGGDGYPNQNFQNRSRQYHGFNNWNHNRGGFNANAHARFVNSQQHNHHSFGNGSSGFIVPPPPLTHSFFH
ncbi:hypothetical protein NE237_022468 [Protea cynaroides]|uniref:TF-B3 domain-containing protein n=1 Tax=Protea cynaroides TaxID=273540 RepID=A0A9Q0HF72_9MAGN|nr:hypothetical protein NE237_022468 [Protea cynaroides]